MHSEQSVLIDGVKLRYCLYHSSTTPRPLIVLIHGLGSNHSRWTEFVETSSLLEHWNILVPDMRGCGNSMVRDKISLEGWSHDLVKILQHEKYPHAIFIGHSLGAHIALILLNNYPEMVRGMVLIDPLSREQMTPTLHRLWRLRGCWKILIAIIMFLNKLGIKRHHIPFQNLRLLDISARQLIKAGKEKEMVKRYSSPLHDLKFNPVCNFCQYSYEILRPLPPINTPDIPTLLLLSSKSSPNKARTPHPLTRELTKCSIKTVNCNHWLLTEKPRETREMIEAWLALTFDHQPSIQPPSIPASQPSS